MNDAGWDLSRIEDAVRFARLEGAGAAADLLAAVVGKLDQAIRSGSLRVGWEQAEKNPQDHRVVLQFQIGSDLFDWFFNAQTGYRAVFRLSAEDGTAFNARLMQAVANVVRASLPATLEARELDAHFVDQGGVLIERSDVENSLLPELSKAWCCGKRMELDGGATNMVVSGTGPKIVVGPDESWPSIEADEDMAWLDIKGAFLGVDGPYQPKSPEERGKRLHERGTA